MKVSLKEDAAAYHGGSIWPPVAFNLERHGVLIRNPKSAIVHELVPAATLFHFRYPPRFTND
jgi:hypothetical protein